MVVGSRAQVWNGNADKTSGGLTRKDLFQDKHGRIRSKRASQSAKKNNNLVKAGWVTEKGKFGAVKVDGSKKSSKRSAKRSARRSVRRSARKARRSARRSVNRR